MSGIAGIIHFDGKPVEPGLIDKMTSAMAHRGPDGINHWVKGSVALGQCMLRTTPESLEEHQPLPNEDESLVLVMDGRVDNWEELRRELLGRGAVLRNRSDAELVLRAYEIWGRDCLAHIDGDFALVIWDARCRELFCARDIVGSKPMFYYYGDGFFLFASEISQFFLDPRVKKEPNENMVAEYLAILMQNREETLWKGVLRLPPGEFLIVQSNRIRKQAYWDVLPVQTLFYSKDEEYAQHLFELLQKAVRVRMRSCTPVGSYLSGGLDSSSIVAMASRIHRKESVTDAKFETFSIIFPGQPNDEIYYIDQVVKYWGLHSNKESELYPELEYYVAQIHQYCDLIEYPTIISGHGLRQLAKERSIRILLTGYGGDEWLTWVPNSYHQLIKKREWYSLLHRLHHDLDQNGIGFLFKKIGNLCRVLGLDGEKKDNQRPWIPEAFAKRTGLVKRLNQMKDKHVFAHHSQEVMYATLHSGWWVHGREMEERATARCGIEQRDPFLDRSIIEFAMKLPEKQLIRRHQTKYVLRRAMDGFLPIGILTRRDKAAFDYTFFHAMEAMGNLEGVLASDIGRLGWFDVSEVRSMFDKLSKAYTQQQEILPFIFPLWMVIGINLWAETMRISEDSM